MKISMMIALFLLTLLGVCKTLTVRFTLSRLLFETNELAINAVIKLLFINYMTNLNLLLRIAFCEYLDFPKLMPDDPLALRPLIKLLKQKRCPRKIQELFYNFYGLQKSKEGKRLLIQSNVNFGRHEWRPYLFSPEDVKKILLKIQSSTQSQIEYLSVSAMSRLLERLNDGFNNHDCFFGTDGLWNLFPISCFSYNFPPLEILERWYEQVKPQIKNDDLLFYRLAYFSWYYRQNYGEFACFISKQLLEEVKFVEFRESVLLHYSQGRRATVLRPLWEIPSYVLADNPNARSALHFEHLSAAFKMGYKVPLAMIIKLFEVFRPFQVSPLICRELLENLNYHNFMSILEKIPQEWKEKSRDGSLEHSYFPKELQSARAQLRLWRHSMLYGGFSSVRDQAISQNPLKSWKKYIEGEYLTISKTIAIEKAGFTYIDCLKDQKSITTFIEGRIVELLLYDKKLPKFLPLLQLCDFIDKEGLKKTLQKENLCNTHCITKDKGENDADKILMWIKIILFDWKVPQILFASL